MIRETLNSNTLTGHNGTDLLNLRINALKISQMIIMRCLIGKMMIEIFVILFCEKMTGYLIYRSHKKIFLIFLKDNIYKGIQIKFIKWKDSPNKKTRAISSLKTVPLF
jgi:hypothetical protein